MLKKTNSLLFKFAVMFFVFAVIVIGLGGYITYHEQDRIYRGQCEEKIQNVSHYLSSLIKGDGEEFIAFRNYLVKHSEDIVLPVDFSSDYLDAQQEKDHLLATKYPGKTLGKDLDFEDLDDETLKAVTVYNYIYWTVVFEKARKDFGVIYTYLLYPTGKDRHMYYIIDGARLPKEDNPKMLSICDDVDEPLDEHEKMWEAWDTGKEPDGFDSYDNEYGKTYAYYTPLYVNGEKAGVIGAEIEVAKVNSDILSNAIRQMAIVSAVILIAVIVLLILINRKYIRKIRNLQSNIAVYASDKNPEIIESINEDISGINEISALSGQFAAMIQELDEYMKNLISTTEELKDTKIMAQELGEQAEKDALTGIRNRHAYDNEVKKIEWNMQGKGFREFGIAMVDLNYLKRINDTFGHDKGNIAIRKICDIVCRNFSHSPVFRIGGDEFVVILENEDYENAEELIRTFKSKLRTIQEDASLEPWEQVSAAIGWSLFDENVDSAVQNVFKRADELMYEDKKAMKAMRD